MIKHLVIPFLFLFFLVSCDSKKKHKKAEISSLDSTEIKHKKHKHTDKFVEEEWEMPEELKEISGMSFINDTQMACIQDENGIIYIYDLENAEVLERIPFAGKGDFEAIAMVDNTAFVLRSDGVIIEIKDIWKKDKLSIVIHPTGLKTSQNTEGLCYDKKRNRLLMSCKGSDSEYGKKKTVFAFDLKTMELVAEPVLLINQGNPVFEKEEKREDPFQPSEIAINPETNDYYFTDSPANKFYILSSDGKMRGIKLDKSVLPQPEGIAINKEGQLFLSSEGVNGPGIIVKMRPEFLNFDY